MRIVVALGGNALLRRSEALTVENQRKNVIEAAHALASIAPGNELIITHGNGPQVGLLATQAASYQRAGSYPLDVLGAETEGMIGYMIEQELGNLLPPKMPFATILTMVEVDRNDPAFENPTKPIGPIYTKKEAEQIACEHGWTMKSDSMGWRRVVPSPEPKRIFEIRPIQWLLEKGVIVICTGGGGIPTVFDDNKNLQGADVVIDKDLTSALLAEELNADLLILATDVDGIYINWDTPRAEKIGKLIPQQLKMYHFDQGSMAPKVLAACAFAEHTGKRAVIGALSELAKIVSDKAGTVITLA